MGDAAGTRPTTWVVAMLAALAFSCLPTVAGAAVLTVTPCDEPTLRARITAASPGDTVRIPASCTITLPPAT